jgi:hypothetical protein
MRQRKPMAVPLGNPHVYLSLWAHGPGGAFSFWLSGWYPHIFLAILVYGKVNGAKGAAANLLLD